MYIAYILFLALLICEQCITALVCRFSTYRSFNSKVIQLTKLVFFYRKKEKLFQRNKKLLTILLNNINKDNILLRLET